MDTTTNKSKSVMVRSIVLRDGRERCEWVEHFTSEQAARSYIRRTCTESATVRRSAPVSGIVYLDLVGK